MKGIMKALLSTIVFLVAISAALGQGTVRFLNDSTTLINYRPDWFLPDETIPGSAGQFYFGLFWAPQGEMDAKKFQFTGLYGTNQAVAGRFSGGVVAIPGHAASEHVAFLVRGWSANIGPDWASVQRYFTQPNFRAYYGTSEVALDVVLGGGAIPAGMLFSKVLPGAISDFTLYPTWMPEPSPAALVLLGTAILHMRRRRTG
jgi:hypothetical protein